MPTTYEPIATTTLGSNSANVTFSSISQAYTDLRLVFNGYSTTNGDEMYMRFNGDTTANNYSWAFYGAPDGTSIIANSTGLDATVNLSRFALISNSHYALVDANIFQYSNTSKYKTIIATTAVPKPGSDRFIQRSNGLYTSNSAVSSLVLTFRFGSIAAGSTVTLYGIKAA